MVAKKMVFQIRRGQKPEGERPLDESPTAHCELDETIDYVTKHTAVETWVMDEKVDFSIYESMPVKYEMLFKQQTLLEPDSLANIYSYVRDNNIVSRDDWLSLG